MVVAKTSRKGKKAWRRNIDTTEIEQAIAQQTQDERQGTAVAHLADEQLFFVDKAGEEGTATALAQGLPVGASSKRQRRRQRSEKLLTCQVILQAAHRGKPAGQLPTLRKKGSGAPLGKQQLAKREREEARASSAEGSAAAAARLAKKPRAGTVAGGGAVEATYDLWDGEEEAAEVQHGPLDCPWMELPPGARMPGKPRPRPAPLPSAAPRPMIAAVEVDAAGCSYNPEPEAHQDAIAEAVAAELAKQVRSELHPVSAPPKTVDYQPESDELLLLQVDAEVDEEEDDDGNDTAAAGDGSAGGAGDQQAPGRASGEEGGEEEEGGGGGGGLRGPVEVHRKTTKDRNRELRRRAAEAEQAARRELKRQRRELDSLQDLQQQVEQEEAMGQARKRRREANRMEKEASQPPRLGKQQFAPEPLQVLLTEEVTGSLRRLKPTPTILRDRFKALQKRGVIEPRVRIASKASKRVEYVHGARSERAVEGQQEINELRRGRKVAKKKAAKSAAAASAATDAEIAI